MPGIADIVVPADEGRDEGRARLGREQRLVGREAQGHVDHRALAGQRLAGLEPVEGQRDLDGDVVGDAAKHLGLAHHLGMIERDHLGRDRARADAGDLGHRLDEVAARLLDQDGIGGDPVEQPGVHQLADVGEVGGVGEELHGGTIPRVRLRVA
jgi:hypothetical protein